MNQPTPAKRVNIVQVKLVREKTMHYKNRKIRSPQSAYELINEFLGDVDREHLCALTLKINQHAFKQFISVA